MRIKLLLIIGIILIIYLSLTYNHEYNYLILKINNNSTKISLPVATLFITFCLLSYLTLHKIITWGPASFKKWRHTQHQTQLEQEIKYYQETLNSSLNLSPIKIRRKYPLELANWCNNFNDLLNCFCTANSELPEQENIKTIALYLRQQPIVATNTDIQIILSLLSQPNEQLITTLCDEDKIMKLYQQYPQPMLIILSTSLKNFSHSIAINLWQQCNKNLQKNSQLIISLLKNLASNPILLTQTFKLKNYLNPKTDPQILALLGNIWPLTNADTAINYFQKNITQAHNALALARLQYRTQAFNQAITNYQQALPQLQKTNPEILLEIALTYNHLGQPNQAIQAIYDYQE